ncbi:MAG: hypothetical protein WAM66_09055 [Acidobacteriaceae bacterium]
MPTGKLCRGVALRNERYCRNHIRNYRLAERERQHDDAMSRLSAQLDAMDIPQLLQTLQLKLDRVTSIVRAYPEARLTLTIVINRLQALNDPAHNSELNPPESNIRPQLTPDQIPEDLSQYSFNELNQMIIGLGGSIR